MSDDFFDDAGPQLGAPSWKAPRDAQGRPAINSGIVGTVVGTRKMESIKFGTKDTVEVIKKADGTTVPRMQMMIVIKTNLRNWAQVGSEPTDEDGNPEPPEKDEGLRAVYAAQRSNLYFVLGRALKEAGVKEPVEGDRFGVKVIGHRPTDKGNPATQHEVLFEHVEKPAPSGEFFGGDNGAPAQDPWSAPAAPATQPTPAAPAPAAPAPAAPAPAAAAQDPWAPAADAGAPPF